MASLGDAVRAIREPEDVRRLFRLLGYPTTNVQFLPEDLDVPPHLARHVRHWELIVHCGPRYLPFQVHCIQLQYLTARLCYNLLIAFSRRHSGYYLFACASDYAYIALATLESVLERPPQPKSYFRVMLLDCRAPTSSELHTLDALQQTESELDPYRVYQLVLEALRFHEHPREFPPWFVPYYEMRSHLAVVRDLLDSSASFSLNGARRRVWRDALGRLDILLQHPYYVGAISGRGRDRLHHIANLLEEAILNLDPRYGDADRAMVAVEQAMSTLGYARWRFAHGIGHHSPVAVQGEPDE